MTNQENSPFVDGMIFKKPRPNAPKFVIGSISIKKAELIAFLEAQDSENEWLNIDVKESRQGKVYCAVNTYKKSTEVEDGGHPADEGTTVEAEDDGDIPF